MSTTVDCAAQTSDGYVAGVNATYLTARATASSKWDSLTYLEVGQQYSIGSGDYTIYRGLLKFDTSAIPADATITQANVKLVSVYDGSTTDFDVYLVQTNWAAQDPLSTGNMDAAFDAALTGTLDALWRNTSGMSLNTQYTSANLDTSYITKGGTTYYGLVSKRDRDGTEPIGNELIDIATANNATAAYRPVLTVTYDTAPARPASVEYGGRVAGSSKIRVYTWDLNNVPHDISHLIEGLTFSTSAPSGFKSCSFSLKRDIRTQYTDIGRNYLLRVRVQMDTVWEGRVEDVGPVYGPNGWELKVTALGFIAACHDTPRNTTWSNTASETTVQAIVKYWLTNQCLNDISSDQSNIDAMGVTITAGTYTTAIGDDAVKVFDDMLKFGYVSGGVYGDTNYAVWEGIQPPGTWAGGLFYLTKRPTTIDYRVRLEEGEWEYQISLEDYFNRIRVYSNSTSTFVEDTASQAELGRGGGSFYKLKLVTDFNSMTLDATARSQIANRYLTYHTQKRARGRSLSLTAGRVTNAYGAPVELCNVRAGHLIRVVNILPSTGAFDGSVNFERDWYIVETEYDATLDTLRITPENSLDALDRQVAQIWQEVKPS